MCPVAPVYGMCLYKPKTLGGGRGRGAENAGLEDAVPESAGPMMLENEGPNRSTGNTGLKMQDRKMQDQNFMIKMQDRKMQNWKMQDWKM